MSADPSEVDESVETPVVPAYDGERRKAIGSEERCADQHPSTVPLPPQDHVHCDLIPLHDDDHEETIKETGETWRWPQKPKLR